MNLQVPNLGIDQVRAYNFFLDFGLRAVSGRAKFASDGWVDGPSPIHDPSLESRDYFMLAVKCFSTQSM